MKDLLIRPETEKDILEITKVHNRAFKAEGEGKLVSLIRDSHAFVPELSIVAEQDGKVVGHVLFSKISLIDKAKDMNSLSLAPVAVFPELQKNGVGQKMIEEGIRKAKALGFSSILVLGDPVYYERFGFKHALTKGIQCRYSCNAFAGIELKPNALANLKNASAAYPEAFSVVD